MSEKNRKLLFSERKKASMYAVYAGIAAIVIFCIWRIIKIHAGIASAAVSAITGWIRMILLIVLCVFAGWILLNVSQIIQRKKKPGLLRMGFMPEKKPNNVSVKKEESSVREDLNKIIEESSMPAEGYSPEEETKNKASSESESSAPVLEEPNLPKSIPAFQENNCCICNGSLEDGYSILFKANNGAEARIDRKCRSALRALSKCDNPEEVLNAGRYLSSYYLSVAPIVLPHLDSFLQKGSDYLRENKKSSESENNKE